MLQDSNRKCYFSALSLLLLTSYMLVMPAQSLAENVDAAKQEQQLRDLESKLEANAIILNEKEHAPSSLVHFGSGRRNQRSIGFGHKAYAVPRTKIPIELEMVVNNDEVERQKKYDDYGHMRFGKRDGEDDDYGHMRFGR